MRHGEESTRITYTVWAIALMVPLGAVALHAQNALTVEADRIATASDLASGGKLQLGDLTPGAATCIAVDSDRPYADLDCDGTKEAGEEYLDGAGGGGGGGDPLSGVYHPDRPPSTCATCEEWNDGSDDLSWRDENMGSSTIDYPRDAQCIVSDGTNYLNVRWIDPPSGDFTFTTHLRLPGSDIQNEQAIGVVVLAAGSEASPSRIEVLATRTSSSGDDHATIYAARWNSYTSVNTAHATRVLDRELVGYDTCLQGRWDDTAGTLAWYYAEDCRSWRPVTTVSSIDALSIGLYVRDDHVTGHELCFDWFRARTDAAGLAGETGE